MKKLILVRHAKSSWETATLSDFDRTLHARGHVEAPMMGQRLKERVGNIDVFISSTAVRALDTATYIAAAFEVQPKDIQTFDSLYHPPVEVFDSIISSIDNRYESAAIFSHNPGITYFVNQLTDRIIDNVPTCGIFCVDINTKDWKLWKEAPKTFSFFDYPKAI
jgi:phosphohistidine phosphatase